ncbi:MAG: Maltose/maltodextrin transporter, permease protein MalF [Geminicoccaceae bacterium]|nr:Maltose/maltodextrin transporter, permease protein MalF [Geminicoccaceae bacterium]
MGGVLLLAACGGGASVPGAAVITFPISALGAEGQVLVRQLSRFMAENPGIKVVQRVTPDAADQKHQLYVQWLNAGASDPDVLQLDVIWTPEFAAAGWILPLDGFQPDTQAFFTSTIAANRWGDSLYALPWFADVGMLYWRTDLMSAPPTTFADLVQAAKRVQKPGGPQYGMVWQGARYEGLITTFVEYLGAYGGQILDRGRVVVNSEAGLRALTEMRDQIYRHGAVPRAVLTWQEEQTRFAFQNGQAAFMRNWPYAYPLMQDTAESRVAGRYSVAPMPAGPGGTHTAAVGGAQLAINRRTEHPDAAWALINYLTQPEQMRERAEVVGQFPTRPAVYDDPELASGLAISPATVRRIIEYGVPRPVTPIYTQLSEILQIHLHRSLTRQSEPAAALARAQSEMQRLLNRAGLGTGEPVARR